MRSLFIESKIDKLCKTFEEGYNVVWTKSDDPYIFVTKDFSARNGTVIMVLVHYDNAHVLPSSDKLYFLNQEEFDKNFAFCLEQIEENDCEMLQIMFSGKPTSIGTIFFDDKTLDEIKVIGQTYKETLNVSYR